MLKKIIIVLILSISILITSFNLKINNFNEDKYINVEVRGEVLNEDVYQLKLGSTFNDLLKDIVLKDSSDISSLSLNEVLYNNQVINIPTKNDDYKISINSSSIDDLITLPGIGISIGNRIIDYRNNNGSFKFLEELMYVKGIGEKKFNKIKEYICL